MSKQFLESYNSLVNSYDNLTFFFNSKEENFFWLKIIIEMENAIHSSYFFVSEEAKQLHYEIEKYKEICLENVLREFSYFLKEDILSNLENKNHSFFLTLDKRLSMNVISYFQYSFFLELIELIKNNDFYFNETENSLSFNWISILFGNSLKGEEIDKETFFNTISKNKGNVIVYPFYNYYFFLEKPDSTLSSTMNKCNLYKVV